MIARVVVLLVLIHGSPADKPIPVLDFPNGRDCAAAMGPVQNGLRFWHPRAITICRETGAPVASPHPMPAPIVREASQ